MVIMAKFEGDVGNETFLGETLCMFGKYVSYQFIDVV